MTSRGRISPCCFFARLPKDTRVTLSATVHHDPALAPAFEAARRLCRTRARGFYLATFFLPPHKRDAVHSIYAFCEMAREALDVPEAEPMNGARAMREHPAVALPRRSPLPVIEPVRDDAPCNVDTSASRLAMLRDRLAEIEHGRLELPSPEARSPQQHALYAFAETVRRFEMPVQPFLEFAEGCAADRTVTRYATWHELELHCRRTTGAIAVALGHALGLMHSDGPRYASALGAAMRLTSILRDVKQDRARGHVYLPQEDLDRFGYTTDELARGVVNARFVALMRFETDRARQLYRAGAESICWLAGDGSRMAASLVVVAQAGVLDAIERQPCDVFTRRADVTIVGQLPLIPRAWRLARRQHDQPMPDAFARLPSGRGLG